MDIPKYEIGTVFVELTRKCNMNCPHCMRGEARRTEMSGRVMRALVDKLRGKSVGTVCLGGGESTLAPALVSKLWKMLVSAGVYPSMFSVVTNGKAMPPAFMNAVAKIQRHAEVNVMASFDDCHDHVDEDEFYERRKRLLKVTAEADRFHRGVSMAFRYGGTGIHTPYADDLIQTHRHTRSQVLMMGRGASHYQGEAAVTVLPYALGLEDPDSPPLCEDDFYVDANGNVWPSCDLSYEFMRRRARFRLGNVTDRRFDWLLAALRFNLKFAKEFPLKLVEPGYEDCWISNPAGPGTFGETYTKSRMEETEILARELNVTMVR